MITMPTPAPVFESVMGIIRATQLPVDMLVRITKERIAETTDIDASVLTGFLANRAASKDGAIAKAAGEAVSAEAVGTILSIGKAAIHKAKDEGRLLAYKEPGKRTFLFPVFQFDGAAVAPWVMEVIDIVGNGFAALHFLTVERKQLKGESYLTRLQASTTAEERNARVHELLTAARRLVP